MMSATQLTACSEDDRAESEEQLYTTAEFP